MQMRKSFDIASSIDFCVSASDVCRLLAAAKARRQNIIEKYMQSHDQINEQINAQNKEPEIPNARSLPAHNQRSPHPLVVAHLSDRVNPFAGGVGLGAAGIVDFIIGDPVRCSVTSQKHEIRILMCARTIEVSYLR